MNVQRTAAITAALTCLASLSLVVGASPASALSGTLSAAEFVAACKAGPVSLDASLKVEGGTASSAGGCTVSVSTDSVLEIVGANLTFGGTLAVSGVAKSRLDVISSNVSASTVRVNLTGLESAFRVDNGSVNAGAGGISAALGGKGYVRVVSAPGVDALRTTGALSLSTGATSLMELSQARISGGSIALALNGTEGVLKSEHTNLTATGAASITTSGGKGLLELASMVVSAGGGIQVTTNGSETVVKSADTSLLAGGPLTVAVSPGGSHGLIEVLGGSTVYRGTTVTVQASVGGQYGFIKLADRSRLESTVGNLLIEVGAFGTTDLADTVSVSPTRIDVLQGPGGKCAMGYWMPIAPFTLHCPNGSF